MRLDRLLAHEFAEARMVVPSVIPQGLVLLAGRPKLGKSWLVLDIALAVSSGGRALGAIDCEEGDVLALLLEDNLRRAQSRARQLGARPNSRLEIATTARRINEGLLQDLDRWCDRAEKPQLVIIDTMSRIRPLGLSSSDAFKAEADSVEQLQKFASERQLAVLVVCHTRKAGAVDVFDTVAGLTAVTGNADAILVLRRLRGQADAILHGTGRDLPDLEMPLQFDCGTQRWQKLEISASAARATALQTRVIEILRPLRSGLTLRQIAEQLERRDDSAAHLLARMEAAGLVEKAGSMWRLRGALN